MQGISPLDGEPLRPAGSNGTRVAGVELMFAPPKTVSALWATSGPYRRAQIEVAHTRAVASALAANRARGRPGAAQERRGRCASSAPRACSPRSSSTPPAASPKTRRPAASPTRSCTPTSWSSPPSAPTASSPRSNPASSYRAARENGAWYRAELAANLRELGVPIERRPGERERYFEVQGVSEELASRWSTRSEDVDRAAADLPPALRREPRAGRARLADARAPAARRRAADRLDVNEAWRAVGEEHGLSARALRGAVRRSARIPAKSVDLRARAAQQRSPSERSMISERELRAKAYELSAGVCRPAEADRLIERAGALGRAGPRSRTACGRPAACASWSSATVQIAERRANENAAPLSEATLQAGAPRDRRARSTARSPKSNARRWRRSPARAASPQLVGRAGTGKGVVISAAARAWQLEGYEVIGTAVAGATAQRLARRREARSLPHRRRPLINGVENGRIRLAARTVVVMDEAGMADTERLARLTELTASPTASSCSPATRRSWARSAPAASSRSCRIEVPTAELSEVHRAHHEWERRAWEQIRNGEPGPRARPIPGPRAPAHPRHPRAGGGGDGRRLGQDQAEPPGGQAVMITDASNAERDQINAIAQERRAAAGELGSHQVELPGKPYGLRAGDEVIFSAQHHPPGEQRVENGITGTIIDTSRDAETRSRSRPTSASHARWRSTPASSPTCHSPTPSTSTRPRASPPRPPASSPAAGRPTARTPTSRSAAPASRPRSTSRREDLGEAGPGPRRDRTARRAHPPQRRAGGEHRQGGRRAGGGAPRRSSARSTESESSIAGSGSSRRL